MLPWLVDKGEASVTVVESLLTAGVTATVGWGAWVTLSLGKVSADVAFIRGMLTHKNGKNSNGNGKVKKG